MQNCGSRYQHGCDKLYQGVLPVEKQGHASIRPLNGHLSPDFGYNSVVPWYAIRSGKPGPYIRRLMAILPACLYASMA